jgi:hypothetical protein
VPHPEGTLADASRYDHTNPFDPSTIDRQRLAFEGRSGAVVTIVQARLPSLFRLLIGFNLRLYTPAMSADVVL